MDDITPTTSLPRNENLPQIQVDANVNDVSSHHDVTCFDDIARKAKLKRVHSEKTHMASRQMALSLMTSQHDGRVDTCGNHLLMTSHDDTFSASSNSVFSCEVAGENGAAEGEIRDVIRRDDAPSSHTCKGSTQCFQRRLDQNKQPETVSRLNTTDDSAAEAFHCACVTRQTEVQVRSHHTSACRLECRM